MHGKLQVGKVLKSCFNDSKKGFTFWFCLAQEYFQLSPCWRRIRFRYNKKLDIIKRELREFIKSLVKEKKYKVKHVIGMNRFLAIIYNISENFENHKFY